MTKDPHFRVETIRYTPNPQQTIYFALHQDYSEEMVCEEIEKGIFPTEEKAGELAVKLLLKGGKGHYGCYFEDTEVLTEKGFVLWSEVVAAGRGAYWLAAIDVESGTVRFEVPSKLYAYDIKDEPLYELKGRYIDQLITNNHRMPISSRTKAGWSNWRFETADRVFGKAVRHRLNGNLQVSDANEIPSEWYKMAGFYFGDGITMTARFPTCIRFRLKGKDKIDWLHRLGFSVAKGKSDLYTVYHAGLAMWLKDLWHDESGKCIPNWIIYSSDSSFHAMMEGLRASDGTNKKPHGFAYDSTNKKAIHTLQAAAAVHGIHGNIYLNHPSKNENDQNCWRIHFNYERHYCRIETQQKGRTEQTTERWVNKTGKVYCASVSTGALIIRRNNIVSVSGNSVEHPQIVFNVGYFPHSAMQQLRTHRVGCSFDVQSFRYSGKRIIDVVEEKRDVESVFYLRPTGFYSDRQGKKYYYSEEQRSDDLSFCLLAAQRYAQRISEGLSEEHARSLIPFDVRQHFILSCNARSLMHFLDLRWKKNAQLEIQILSEMLFGEFQKWCPVIADWYYEDRHKKGAQLAP